MNRMNRMNRASRVACRSLLNVFLIAQLVHCFVTEAACAQHLRNGLGDASTISSQARNNSYGINDSNAGDAGGFDSFTRHRRMGDSTGIGGSFLDTTSPTSESRRAQRTQVINVPTSLSVPRVRQPGMQIQSRLFSELMTSASGHNLMLNSPAIGSVQMPSTFRGLSTALDSTPTSLFLGHQSRLGSIHPMSDNMFRGQELMPSGF
jgi:hypothetical protein